MSERPSPPATQVANPNPIGMRHFSVRIATAALAVFAAQAASQQTPATNHAIQRANLDTTCAACEDFYTFANGGWTFANGGWLKRSTIPAAYGEWGAFEELQDKNEAVVRSIEE